MLKFRLGDGVICEPFGGAHWNYDEAANNLKTYITPIIAELKEIKPDCWPILGAIRLFSVIGECGRRLNIVAQYGK